MPVYNEVDLIATVVQSWATELDRLGIDYLIAVYDDGSRDGTVEALRQIRSELPRVVAQSHANMGHGPTILRGYADASSEWVFQVDSDHELWPTDFEQVWCNRHEYDLLIGYRVNRDGPMMRKLVSWTAQAAVRALFQSPVRDVNVPFRLVRRASLQQVLPFIPSNAFAPNVIMSGLAKRHELRISEYPVRHHRRAAGVTSLSGTTALIRGWRCLREMAGVALRRV